MLLTAKLHVLYKPRLYHLGSKISKMEMEMENENENETPQRMMRTLTYW
jgi:hypothetical protein